MQGVDLIATSIVFVLLAIVALIVVVVPQVVPKGLKLYSEKLKKIENYMRAWNTKRYD